MLICVVSCTVAALVTIYILPCLLTALAEHGFPITVDILHLHDLALCILSCQRLIHRVSKPHISYKLRRRHFARLISLHLFSLSLSRPLSLGVSIFLSRCLATHYTLHLFWKLLPCLRLRRLAVMTGRATREELSQ